MYKVRKSANIKDFLAVLEATIVVDRLLVTSACIQKVVYVTMSIFGVSTQCFMPIILTFSGSTLQKYV